MRSAWMPAAFAALAAAQTTTMQYMLFNDADTGYELSAEDLDGFAARLVGIDESATTYEIGCATSSCGIASDNPITLIQGPETLSVGLAVETTTKGITASVEAHRDCKFTHSSESVSCTVDLTISASGQGQSISTETSTSESSVHASDITFAPLTVTDGVYAFTSNATASSTPVSVSATAATAVSTSATGAAAPAHGPMVTVAPMGAAAMAAIAALL